jgi:hypothetical protein
VGSDLIALRFISRCAFAAIAVVAVGIGPLASTAAAHGVQGRAQTPIPNEVFIIAAGAVLVVSFLGLAFGWSRPILAHVPWRRLPRPIERVILSRLTILMGRAIVLAGFLFVLGTAAFGSTRIGDNPAPLILFVVWWVGLVPISALFGNVWRELNPWGSIARVLRFPGQVEGRPLPAWLGYWPAAVVLLVFAWFELVYPAPASPRLIAVLIVLYSIGTLAAMRRWGVDAWLDQGEAFSVYTGLLALLSPVELRGESTDRQLGLRPPVVAATRLRVRPGLVGLIAVLIATVTYDGLSASRLWEYRDVIASERLIGLGFSDFTAGVIIGTLGLLGSLAVFALLYEGFSFASARVAGWRSTTNGRLAVAFIHSLVPIALAYFVAHYLTLFVFQSQDLIRLASDPLGTGADYFGTADHRIDFQLVSANAIWITQVAAIVIGHVVALAMAHDRALELERGRGEALRSQAPMLILMVLLTVAGLWSLSAGMAD